MRNRLFILIILLSGLNCSERRRIRKIGEAVGKCKSMWQYFEFTKPIKGVVLLHTKGYCGYANIHANTIIIVNKIDTIRVDGPCYTENIITSDSILVNPYKTDEAAGAAIGDGKYDCTIKKTCNGIISRIK